MENYMNFIDLSAMTAGISQDLSLPSLAPNSSPSTAFTASPQSYPQLLQQNNSVETKIQQYSSANQNTLSVQPTGTSIEQDGDLDEASLKRKRNTEAARRSRQRKLDKLDSLEHEVQKLENDKRELAVDVAVLRSERENYVKREREMAMRSNPQGLTGIALRSPHASNDVATSLIYPSSKDL
jgi:hypothetical protein